jgi:predicted amidophosphoribosyltransferase
MYVPPRQNIAGTNILLIDDVMTTGASLAEATRALKAAGAKNVYAAVFAQKVL